jgi:glycosyltransferase involved in cell wall biosynthesis
MQRYVVALLGARMHYAIPKMLNDAGMLEHLYTDVIANKGWPRLLSWVPKRVRPLALDQFAGRVARGIPTERITAFPGFAWHYWRRRRRSRSIAEDNTNYLWAGRKFCELVVSRGFRGATGVFVFDSVGLEILEAAKRAGLRGIMEQSVAPRELVFRLLAEEHERFPGWEAPLPSAAQIDILVARERQEWALADRILCGSEFVAEGIGRCGGPRDRATVVPYGVDARYSRSEPRSRGSGPLRVLTVGEVSLRKGSPDILEAARRLGGAAEFRMVGPIGITPSAARRFNEVIPLRGPVPRMAMRAEYDWADVFLLPSLCEGSATVVYEALAAGLPVVCTPNTGAVVRDGVEGHMVPIRDPAAIVDRLSLLHSHPARLREMSANALARAADYSLDHYRRRLMKALQ